MRWSALVLLVCSVGAVGWLAPSLHTAGPSSATPHAGASPRRPAAAAYSSWDSAEATLERAGDGHFYADGRVHDRPTRFLVDTGASMVVLTGPDAEAAGLAWDEADLTEIGRGATGPVYGVRVRLDSISVGGIEVHDVDAAIVPNGLDVSLLGQSFLGRLDGVRIENDRMVLGSA